MDTASITCPKGHQYPAPSDARIPPGPCPTCLELHKREMAKADDGWRVRGMRTNGGPDPWPVDSSEILQEGRKLASDLKQHAIWYRGGELVSQLVARIKQLEYGQVGKVPL